MSKKIGIVGAGYVGLPLAVEFAKAGQEVVCIEVDSSRITQLNAGKSYIEDVASSEVMSAVESGNLKATNDYQVLTDCETVVIAVPTPLDASRQPDFGPLIDSATSLQRVLQEGQLIVLESTTYPGTTRERLIPLLEESGLAAGKDFNVAYSPERIDPGRTDYTLKNTVKVVGGLTEECRKRAAAFYGQVVDQIQEVSTPEVAELSKLLENIFRSVNIALVNELAMLCDRMEIDIWEVVEAASTKPYGFMRFDPGPGMGGHCLPVDPFYLAYKAREFDFDTEFVELSGEINQNMPYFCVDKIKRALNGAGKPLKGSTVLILGVAYKPGVADLRESPALKIMRLVRAEGADVHYHDPHVAQLPEFKLESERLTDTLESADVVAIVTAHGGIDYEEVVSRSQLVLDFRGVTRGIKAENLVRL